MTGAQTVAQILLDSSLPQLDHLFDYRVPQELAERLCVGQRVKVPLRSGSRSAFGYVVGIGEESTFVGELSPVLDIVSSVPVLQPEIALLARTLADRAAGSASDVIRLAIPPRHVRTERSFLASREDAPLLSSSALESAKPSTEGPHRKTVIATPFPRRLVTGEWVPGWALDIAETAQQYLQGGKSVIIAVPDFTDLDALHDALQATLAEPDVICRLDAHQSNAERYAQFLQALEPGPRILLGNRSAVYAPAHRLGALILWDDADPLFAEPLAPYIHARDAAIIRGEQQGADVLLFGNLRSLDAHRLVRLGYLSHEPSTVRGARRVLAADSDGLTHRRVPDTVLKHMRLALESGPVLVQVASPGAAQVLTCASCGERQSCRQCSSALRSKSESGQLVLECRVCKWKTPRRGCLACGAEELREFGAGSEKTLEQLAKQFPRTTVLRSDGENRRALVGPKPALVVATRGAEPLAAGGYACVVLLDADRMLAAPRLSVEEETARHWVNAAAFARPDGLVVLANARGRLAEAFAVHALDGWLNTVLEERAVLRFPPAVRVATVSGTRQDVRSALDALGNIDGVDWFESDRSTAAEAPVTMIVRFPYAAGPTVANLLRASLVTSATVRRRRGRSATGGLEGRFRVHLDDRSAFDHSE